ncbi:and other transporter-domain-containing protein [Clohesyomyces aquaticus]|uniref:And other transporter-domain-containing protein n=1 Tax=Clohesyomyces aquaticus TaxID=1231657 RepID=A0A1Y1Y7A5_9PLEO|nr:and other transporter-domain-containing protein [Clohesyomyces aquaticus]
MVSQETKPSIVETSENIPEPQTETETTRLGHLANAEDHNVGKLESFRNIYTVWVVLLVSFENQAAGNVIGIPEFREDFGSKLVDAQGVESWVLNAKWQSAFQGAPVASVALAVVGALGCGQIADWLGRRTVIMLSLVITFAAITMEFVATSNELFFGGKFLNGFAVGALASICIAPLALRDMLTCLTALAYTLGPLTVALITNTTGVYTNRWAYRAGFCAQYGFAVFAAIGVFFMPGSPWWLVSKGRQEAALKALHQLGHTSDEGSKKLALIAMTLGHVRRETDGVTYLECFPSYSTYYMKLAGFSTTMSFKLQIVQQVISLVGNVMSWYLVDRVGRRNLTFWGLFVLTIILFLMAGLATLETPAGSKGAVSMILLYCWWYNVTICATAYTLLCEVSTSRLRIKTIAIGLALQNALNTMWSFVLPYLFNPDKLNLGGRLGFIFAGLSVICLVYLWIYQPETAGRTYEKLDEMFIKKILARKFKSYVTDAQLRGEEAMGKKPYV